MTEDLYPIAWGAQDRFHAHFIVKIRHDIPEENFLARSRLNTKGYFASKKVIGVQWIGGTLTDALNSDNELKTMITKLSYTDAQIYVEPTNGVIRIHGRWKGSYDFTITKELFAVYDKIAFHIKRESGPPPHVA